MSLKRIAGRRILLAVLGFAFCQRFCFCGEDFIVRGLSSSVIKLKSESLESGENDSTGMSTLDVLGNNLKEQKSMNSSNLFNNTRSERHNSMPSMDEDGNITSSFRIVDLKVLKTDLANKMVKIRWTSYVPNYDLRYHWQLESLQQYFNSCSTNFQILNETVERNGHKLIHLLVLALPDELFKKHNLGRVYFAVKAFEESNVSNLAVAVFQLKPTGRSPFLECVLAAIVITSVTASVVVSISALIVVKLGLHRGSHCDRRRSDYYYDTVTEITVLEQRNLILSNFDSRRISSTVP
ncbi:hypothetical protein CHUAL_002528 [Chamberlinius hualienensis]